MEKIKTPRKQEIFAEKLSPGDIEKADLAGAVQRLRREGETGKFRKNDSYEFQDKTIQVFRILSHTNPREHILFKSLEEADWDHPLIEETIHWNIQSPHTDLKKEVAKTILDVHQKLLNLPEAIQNNFDFPLIMTGYLLGHSTRVAIYSALLAQEMKQDPLMTALGGFCHDLGKLQTQLKQLMKTFQKKPLTPEAYQQMKQHPVYGASALNQLYETNQGEYFPFDLSYFREIYEIILYHHVRPDRHDEKSYPPELNPKDASAYSLIVSVADAYDAMTTRDHNGGKREILEKIVFAREEIQRQKGRQFNPAVADAFCAMDVYPVFSAKD